MNYTNLIYQGTLEIEVNRKKYTQHNSGTSNLFKLFSEIMCREIPDGFLNSLPGAMLLYCSDKMTLVRNPDVTDPENQKMMLLRKPLSLTAYSSVSEIDGQRAYQANFRSELHFAQLLNTNEQYEDLTLALVSNDLKSILAVVDFNKEVFNIVRNGGEAIMKWIITVSNLDDSQEI